MNMKSILVICFAIALLLEGCGKQSGQLVMTYRTDVEPISRRLPELGELRSVLWSSELLSKDSLLSPPIMEPVYRLRGFAYLRKERFAELVTEFRWEAMSNGWKPSLIVTNEKLESAQWCRSGEFTKKMKPDQFPGELFMNTNDAVVFFDFEVN